MPKFVIGYQLRKNVDASLIPLFSPLITDN